MPETLVHSDSAPLLPPPYARLVVVKSFNAAHLGETFVLDRVRMRFGRASSCKWNEINLFRDEYISNGVGWFERKADGNWWAVDDGSTNGVSINDVPLRRPVEGVPSRYADILHQGDQVQVGRVVMEFHAPDATQGERSLPPK